jgi:hypothetical protein
MEPTASKTLQFYYPMTSEVTPTELPQRVLFESPLIGNIIPATALSYLIFVF